MLLSLNFGLLGWIDFIFLVIGILLLLFLVVIIDLQSLIPSDSKFLLGSLGQREGLEELLLLVLEFGTGTTWLGKVLPQSQSSLLHCWVVASILKFHRWMQNVDVVIVRHNICVSILAFGDVGQQRWVLWLGKCQLIVDEGPGRFILHLISGLSLLLGDLTPGAFTDDSSDLEAKVLVLLLGKG